MRSLDRRRRETAETAFRDYAFPDGRKPVSVGDWVWMTSSNSWTRAIGIREDARGELPTIAGKFSVEFLPNAAVIEGVSADFGGKRLGKAADTRIDEWDGAVDGDSWYLPMPAETLGQAISGETPSISITLEGGTYWLHNGSRPGEDDFFSLEDAKAAGERLAALAHDGLSDRMARDAGLDPDLWVFQDAMTGIWFASVEDDTLSVERRDNDKWIVARDEIIIGEGRTASDALQSIAVAPAP